MPGHTFEQRNAPLAAAGIDKNLAQGPKGGAS
jgi:hypothetical protein